MGKKKEQFSTRTNDMLFQEADIPTCAPRHRSFLNVLTGTDVHGAAPSTKDPVSPTV